MDFSVVIRTYTEERWDYLVNSVESVRQQTLPPAQIVVVVDHNPELLARVTEYFPDATVVDNRQPRGSGGAWNSGVMAAQGQVVAFLDDDAIAAPEWLERLSETYEDADVVGVGGAILAVWPGGRPRWFPEEFGWVVGCDYKGLPEDIAPVRNLIGCNMSLRRVAFEAVGGFRTDMGHVSGKPIGDDETELCIRLSQNWPDKVLLYNPHAVVHHVFAPNRTTWRYFLWRCYLEGRSKAMLSQLVGTTDGLAAERAYTFRALPRGVLRGIGDTILRRDVSGLLKAGAIVMGLLTAAAGYVIGFISWRLGGQRRLSATSQFPAIDPVAGDRA
jgi:GT2 family glycosyltransferase